LVRLVDNAWLTSRLSDEQTRIIDPRPRLKYLQGHIPKAVNLPLSEIYDKETLELQPDEKLDAIFGRAGIGMDSNVTLYDSYDGQSAAMLGWLLEYLGHSEVSILSNYLEGWTKQGGQLLYRPVIVEPRSFSAKPNVLGRAAVNDVLRRGDSKLLDFRGEDEFRGKVSTEPRSGHIPGAVNVPWTELIGRDDQFLKSQSELSQVFADAGLNEQNRIIAYCSNGPRAALGYIALQQLGYQKVRVYDGSFHQWARTEDLPLEQGISGTRPLSKPVQASASPCLVDSIPGLSPR
jgi:thiosulfate/3-mercaptopyruvate sulfurtransferase